MENKNQPLTEALFYILLAARKPVHGYGIIQEVAQMDKRPGHFGPRHFVRGHQLPAGAKAGSCSTAAEEGSRRKKEYLITAEGRAVFQAELKRLREPGGKWGENGETHDQIQSDF